MKRTMKGNCSIKIVSLFLGLGIIMNGCGEGITTTSSAGAGSPGIAVEGATKAISLASMGLNSITNPGSQAAPSFKRSKGINEAVADLYANMSAASSAARSPKAPMMAPTTTPCGSGGPGDGSVTKEITPTTYTATFNNCVHYESNNTIRVTENGTIALSQTDSDGNGVADSFTMQTGTRDTPYTLKTTRTSDNGLLSEFSSSITISGSFSGATTACGGKAVPNSVTITMSGNSSFKWDADVDGTLDGNRSTTLTSLTLNTTIQQFNATTCKPAMGTITMSGGIKFTDNINTSESASISSPLNNPMRITWQVAVDDTGNKVGENVTIDGTFTADTACFTGSLTIATLTAIFTPNSSDCPTSGKIDVTGDMIATITYTDSGVLIDDGSNGTVDVIPPPSCNDAKACGK